MMCWMCCCTRLLVPRGGQRQAAALNDTTPTWQSRWRSERAPGGPCPARRRGVGWGGGSGGGGRGRGSSVWRVGRWMGGVVGVLKAHAQPGCKAGSGFACRLMQCARPFACNDMQWPTVGILSVLDPTQASPLHIPAALSQPRLTAASSNRRQQHQHTATTAAVRAAPPGPGRLLPPWCNPSTPWPFLAAFPGGCTCLYTCTSQTPTPPHPPKL